jgi:hypothetical protein
MKRVAVLTLLLTTPVHAEVDEATKIEALKLGYILNGNSMVRWHAIDLVPPPPLVKQDRVIPLDKPKRK